MCSFMYKKLYNYIHLQKVSDKIEYIAKEKKMSIEYPRV